MVKNDAGFYVLAIYLTLTAFLYMCKIFLEMNLIFNPIIMLGHFIFIVGLFMVISLEVENLIATDEDD
jgi:hypothetical protein